MAVVFFSVSSHRLLWPNGAVLYDYMRSTAPLIMPHLRSRIQLLCGGGDPAPLVQVRRLFNIPKHHPSWSWLTNSSALCPCSILPGPQIKVATPASSNNPPSVPKATVENAAPAHHCDNQPANSDCGSVRRPGYWLN